jgi:hypothetical protein
MRSATNYANDWSSTSTELGQTNQKLTDALDRAREITLMGLIVAPIVIMQLLAILYVVAGVTQAIIGPAPHAGPIQ